jgi:hypothetical protein
MMRGPFRRDVEDSRSTQGNVASHVYDEPPCLFSLFACRGVSLDTRPLGKHRLSPHAMGAVLELCAPTNRGEMYYRRDRGLADFPDRPMGSRSCCAAFGARVQFQAHLLGNGSRNIQPNLRRKVVSQCQRSIGSFAKMFLGRAAKAAKTFGSNLLDERGVFHSRSS